MRSGVKVTGFTLVEMLVVIAIISILGGLVMGAVGAARRNAKIKATEVRITLIASALSRYENDFSDYPPGDLNPESVLGAESLWRCLTTDKKGGPYLKSSDVPLVDSDDNGEMEISDEWRGPIIYLHHREYGNQKPNPHDFRLVSRGVNKVFEFGNPESDDIVNWNKLKPDQ